ncbi:tyrosine-type recombinase/integrase [Nitratireductor sp. ZSWI3]|uniref:tyrosine-type recombinase/integrase n=1 Tax=Nitratireductor sp. ZSWI3 TaxID=2966359 RepID=UPI00214F621D|nr:tyrosine-type recombinase/integrase [Nitratireductor sp. ZSWI3]MCR4269350.1 tyrosine-type recombinase/integrase [Nitratireductor sp. ZSWI3]
MFEEIFFPRTAAKHRAAPLAEPRARYLRHLKEIGTSRATLRKCANDHLHLVRLLNVQEGDRISIQGIEAAATIWSQPKGRRCDRAATAKTRQRFVSHCVDLLRYLGWVEETEEDRHPHHAEVRIFEGWLRNERGLSDATIDDYCRAADHFFVCLAGRGTSLDAIQMADVDEVIAIEHGRGAWNRRTIHDFAQRLRPFFGFAEKRGWCRPGLGAGIMAPGYMADETVPKGIKRDDVERLLASVQGERPVDKRDRAILMLFIAYGLRAGEVAGLRLDDLDWENGMLRVRCPKPGRTHLWPLSQAVGNTILSYIRDARPSGFGRSLFFTSHAPIRPLGRKALGKMVRDRLAGIGVVAGRRGPHALRHAAAQHLLDQGMSMKLIGDFLGHRDPSSTAIYAKVNLVALREVAALDLEGLA